MSKPAPVVFPRVGRAFAAARVHALWSLRGATPETDPLAAVSRRLGRPLRLLGVDPAGDRVEAGAICVHVRDAAGVERSVRVSGSLAAEAAAGALGVGTWALPAGEPPEPLIGVLSVQALRCLDALATAGCAMELVDIHAAAMPRPADGAGIPVSLRLSLGSAIGRVEVDVAADPASSERIDCLPAWLESLPMPVTAVVARGRIPAADLRGAAVGDAIAFDEVAAFAGPGASAGEAAWLEAAGAPRRCGAWLIALADEEARIVGRSPVRLAPDHGGSRPMTDGETQKEPSGFAARFRGGPGGGEARSAEQPPGAADRTVAVDAPGEPLAGLDEVPVEVAAVAGRTTMALRDLAALAPGSVVPLGRAPGGSVDLLANGVVFARGRLVDLDGELAAEITEIRATAPRHSASR